MTTSDFDPTAPLPEGRVSLQASAGTGKTWTIAALVTRYVAEGIATIDELLVVTFTRAATAELRHRIRTRLTDTHRHLQAVLADPSTPPPDDDPVIAMVADPRLGDAVLGERLERVQAALADIDRALISTIHGFAHQVLRSVGHVGDIDGQRTLVEDVDDLVLASGRDLLVRLYADEPDDDVLAARPSGRDMTAMTIQRLRHPHARISPAADGADDVDDVDDVAALQRARMATLVSTEIGARKGRRDLMTFDDLLHQLAAALRDDAMRPLVLAAFRHRFRIALVDEAQDTDPVQWEIIEAMFADRTLVIIGDPKQAIYRFRGADVHAYVRAVATTATTTHGLPTNHRADDALVQALNALLRDTTFGHERIGHSPVRARHPVRLHDPAGTAPLHLRLVRKVDGATLYAGDTRRRIAADVAARITSLLRSGATIDDAATGPRPVSPADMAILVRAHATVDHLERELEAARVPFVRMAVGSVFDAPGATHWRTLLVALARPSSTTALRALAGSPFVGWPADELARAGQAKLDELAADVARWRRRLDRDGVASLLRAIDDRTFMTPRLLGTDGGDRLLTDIDHVGELLHRSEVAGLGPAAMVDWLAQQRERVTADDIPAEERSRRLESDSAAVTIMTVHAAKGLEFPIVYLPYMMWSTKRPSVPFTTTGTEPVLELGGPDLDVHREQGLFEEHGEAMRLAYVALTRARHRVEAWWWEASGCTKMPLTRLLVRQKARPAAAADRASGAVKGMDAALRDLADLSGGTVDWADVDDRPRTSPLDNAPSDPVDVSAASFDRTIDTTWTRSSYSGLTTPLARVAHRGDPPEVDGATDVRDDDHDHPAVVTPEPVVQPLLLPLGAMAGGSRIGTMIHDLYEHVDFGAADVRAQVQRRLHAVTTDVEATLGMPAAAVADGVVASLATPLGAAFGDLRLRDVAPADRLDEMAFELPVATAPGAAPLDVAAIRTVFDGLPDDDPLADYPRHLDDPALARSIRGSMTGFVDLVLRRHDGATPVFHVVDYKTNVRYRRDEVPTTAHYDHPSLVAAMHEGHYPLQAALYAVALHRYLRLRLPDYEPDANLGAIGYLFVRGMVGPTTPVVDGNVTGVLAWHPPSDFVVALSDVIHRGRGRA